MNLKDTQYLFQMICFTFFFLEHVCFIADQCLQNKTPRFEQAPRPYYYDYQLSEARREFGDEVLTSKRQCCQGQLAAFPMVTNHHVTSPAIKARQIEIASGD